MTDAKTSNQHVGDSISKLLADMATAAHAARTNQRDGVAAFVNQWIERLKALTVETPDALDAARYRFLRQPDNAIVYAKDKNAWGDSAHFAAGHVRYETPEQLDAAIDTARGAVKTTSEVSK